MLGMGDIGYLGNLFFYCFNFDTKRIVKFEKLLTPGSYQSFTDKQIYYKEDYEYKGTSIYLSIQDLELSEDEDQRNIKFDLEAENIH